METLTCKMATAARRQQAMRLGPVAYDGFPVRSLTRHANLAGSGEWITAYQADQRRRLKAVLSASVARTTSSPAATLRPPTNTREVSSVPRKYLSASFLLHHCYVDHPSDLCVCHINGEGLQDFKPNELTQFDNVIHIDASDNRLPLEAFRNFPALRKLELTLNHVMDVGIQLGDFDCLQVLDLSYNSLSGCSLLDLGTLPSLKELRLTGNNLVALPVQMSRPFTRDGTEPERTIFGIRFSSLERLWLDDNKLTDQATFATLAGLRKLKYLNLDHNEIYTIPQLRLIGTSPLKSTSRHRKMSSAGASRSGATPTILEEEEPNEADDQLTDSQGTKGRGLENTASISPIFTRGHHPVSPRTDSPSQSRGMATPTLCVDPPPSSSELRAGLADSMAPFPQLETLSLVNNLILTAEGLVACESWPALKEVIIYSNPLTRITSGMPRLLQTRLVDDRGITVIRQQPSPQKRHAIGRAAKDFKKVSTAPPPTIPKHPLLPSLEAPPGLPLMLEYPSTPPSSDRSGSSPQTQSDSDEKDSHQGVFLTQPTGDEPPDSPPPPTTPPSASQQPLVPEVRGAKEKAWSSREEFQAKRRAVKEKYQDIPERFKGYEFLLDTYDDPSMTVPSDVHSCVRALQHTLRHPVVFGDSKPSSQPTKSPGPFLKRKSPVESTRSDHQLTASVRSLQRVLDDIRTRCVTMETNLTDVLRPKAPPTRSIQELQRDSQMLLTEMQAKYDQVRASSLQAIMELSKEGSRPPSQTTPTGRRRLSPYQHPSLSGHRAPRPDIQQ